MDFDLLRTQSPNGWLRIKSQTYLRVDGLSSSLSSRMGDGWNHPMRQFPKALGVTCPFSMLRVQVVDQGKSNAVTRAWDAVRKCIVLVTNV